MKTSNLYIIPFIITSLAISIISCKQAKKEQKKDNSAMSSESDSENIKYAENFVDTIDGKQTKMFLIKNKNGLSATFTNYGQRLVTLNVPDKNGEFKDIVLGFESLEKYKNSGEKYFGATIGRYGNRIAKGKFSIDGSDYTLATNNGENHLHGGNKGFESVVWNAKQISENKLEFTRTSPDMEEGYPGNLYVKVTYMFTDDNELKIDYEAKTDKVTHVNLTHHSFFNLKGEGNGTINNHVLMINANSFIPVDKGLIPTGEIRNVAGSPFNFTEAKAIGKDLSVENQQLKFGLGYDHNFVLNLTPINEDGLVLAAKVLEPESGRIMEVYTNEPGIQLYGGNFLDGSAIGKRGKAYIFRGAFCLETQHYPDSPNQAKFPKTILKPDVKYKSTCVYKFSTE